MDNEELVIDLVAWVSRHPRSYDDVMEAWRTSCPRLTIWEDAVDHGLVERALDADGVRIVRATDAGHAFLASKTSG